MTTIINNLNKVRSDINNKNVKIIAVSKTFSFSYIKPLVDSGHIHFGENKVQEAETKWSLFKKTNQEVKLHMIGKLQSNKAKKAIELFDYIHSLDNKKLADTLSKNESILNKNLKYFIQVNIGNENQKSGILPSDLDNFFTYCTKEKNLNVIGLMAIPPNDNNTRKYFQYLSEANASLELPELSIGMSSDYKTALDFKASFLRIGSLIFGPRN
ncbi:MAG: YggS family pyridoxal phosphate-dependent enzyme [Candidatus Pelagibacter sp.]|nr:YggS family pyridoxal phosphate-dependent enzyme [Candidatus Pelagibacter sp.]RPG11105.1 MAG: YggS family pyridoxal phosphate-dependent enzyme [Pelagibacteraceae bacterium TMED170]|tara:strand:+ start:7497 stop:8135 length:639 start_codon:yes stop_codon:yes gene_type:complete